VGSDNQRLTTTWTPWPDAQSVVDDAVEVVKARSPWLRQFERALHAQTGEQLVRRIDHLALPAGQWANRLGEAGFVIDRADKPETAATHAQAYVPKIYLCDDDSARCALAIDSLEGFIAGYPGADASWAIEGAADAPLRRCRVAAESSIELWIVQRCGSAHWPSDDRTEAARAAARQHLETFRTRSRDETHLADRFSELRQLIEHTVQDLGQPWTAALFARAEREHWLAQTPSAQRQARRQDAWGLGWAHHDHHTYRCSRRWFAETVAVLELLGLAPRESFHAGNEAGWGAQVLEHPLVPFVVFSDVDLAPTELAGDFAHTGLAPADSLGTVGLWCGLHGESMFGAGLHHLAIHVDFDALSTMLEDDGIEVMPPFADIATLRQAFTVASPRPVAPKRLRRLVADSLIAVEQAELFEREGALGSHIELIERRQAYKGFHQQGVSVIIARTDPRTALGGT